MDDFERLRAIVDADAGLQAELLAYMEAAPFCAALARIAEQFELIVPEERIWRAIEEGRAVWYATWS